MKKTQKAATILYCICCLYYTVFTLMNGLDSVYRLFKKIGINNFFDVENALFLILYFLPALTLFSCIYYTVVYKKTLKAQHIAVVWSLFVGILLKWCIYLSWHFPSLTRRMQAYLLLAPLFIIDAFFVIWRRKKIPAV